MSDTSQHIALVGMAGRFPGAADIAAFWRVLVSGTDAIGHFAEHELEHRNADTLPGVRHVGARGVLDRADEFDAEFFGITPREAELMDPQHRVFLQCCWHALEDAGYDPAAFPGLIGVYAGVSLNTYLLYNLQGQAANLASSYQVGAYQTMLGNDKDFMPTRVSYKLGLRGPSMAVQTACSTSLVAVAQACQALLSYQADLCLAGGVSISFPQKRDYPYTEDAMVSPDGRCRPFDADAQGTVFGHGAGVVALRRYDDAVADGDHILAVIRGSAVNNDGANKIGFAAPSVDGQADVIGMAQALAGVEPANISYVEAHGTGTPLGDPIEVAALTQAFRRSTEKQQFCTLGTGKGNVGHLDVAAGVTGLIKTVLQLQHRQIPAVQNFRAPNPRLALEGSPFRIADRLQQWDAPRPLRAGVSAFGVGGTNVHVVVEEAPAVIPLPCERAHHLLVLSARSIEALDQATSRLKSHLAEHDMPLAEVAYTLQTGRRAFSHRRVLVADSRTGAVTALGDQTRLPTGKAESQPGVAFLIPGQGAQHAGMAAGIYQQEPLFRQELDRLCRMAEPHLGLDLRTVLFPSGDSTAAHHRLRQTEIAQPALFIVSLALAKLWQSWGVQPQAFIGHSVGEYVAAVLSGVMVESDALRLVALRGRLIQGLAPGTMLSVRLAEAALLPLLPAGCSIAAINGPQLCVASGPSEVITELSKRLDADGIVHRSLKTSHAFHSPMMDEVLPAFADAMAGVRLSPPTIPLVSCVTGAWLTAAEATDPQYWVRHVRATVRFADAVVLLRRDRQLHFLEIGPGRTLTTLARQSAVDDSRLMIASLPSPAESAEYSQPINDRATLLEAVGRLWISGASIDWKTFHAHESRRRVSLPGYPFARTRFWISPAVGAVPPPTACTPAIFSTPTSATSTEGLPNMTSVSPPPTPTAGGGRRPALLAALRSLLAELSGTPAERIDAQASFIELGFDSLMLTQVSMALQSRFKAKISFRQLLGDLGSMDALLEHLDRSLPPEAFAPAPVRPAAPAITATANHGNESPLEQLIRRQMEMMAEQLNLLKGGLTPSAPSTAAAPTVALPASAGPSSATAAEFKAFGPYKPIQRGPLGGLTPQQQAALDRFTARYTQKTKTSKSLTQKNRPHLADPRVAGGFRAQWKELVYPIITNRSKGTRLWDVDGNQYIDLLNGFGCIFFGHAPDFVVEAVNQQMSQGYEIGPQTLLAGEAAQLMCEMTGLERTTFCNTGSEAVMAAMRLARTVTGRMRIVSFLGDYHGTFDEVLAKSVGEDHRSLPIAPGIPQGKVENLTVLPYGTDETLAWIRTHADELAAVLIEPVQSRHPALQPKAFIQEVRRITAASGTALIMDEVITGFRTHPGGAQALFGVKADLASYGKVIGGGMPIGVLCGNRRFMDALDGGMWQYGDDSFPEVGVTFFAGTFVRHPATMAAVVACLQHLKREGPALQAGVDAKCTRLVERLNLLFRQRGFPTNIEHFSSYFYFTFAPEHRNGSLIYYLLRDRGVHIQEGFPCFLTTVHTDDDLEQIYQAFVGAVDELITNGFFPEPSGRVNEHKRDQSVATAPTTTEPVATQVAATTRVALTEPQREILLAARYSREANCAYNESATLRFGGKLDIPALTNALHEIVARHEALRARFPDDGETQEFLPALTVAMPFDDWSSNPTAEQEKRFTALLMSEGETPFDLSQGPLLRARIIRFAAMDHALVLVIHHIVCDGWSTNVICDELGRLYSSRVNGTPAQLAPVVGYREYVAWQQQDAPAAAKSLLWWKTLLGQPPTLPELPSDRPRPNSRTFAGDTVRRHLDVQLLRGLRTLAAVHRATLFTTLLTTFRVVLSRLSGQEDLVIGVPVAGQPLLDERGDFLVGHCVNFLPMRDQVPNDQPLATLLPAAQQAVSAALAQQNTTYGSIVRALNVPREANRLPLTEVQFNLERWAGAVTFSGLTFRFDTNPRRFVFFDLFINAVESTDGLDLVCDFNRDLFDSNTVARWLGHVEQVLSELVSDPRLPCGRIPLLSPVDLVQLTDSWACPQKDHQVPTPVHHLVEHQAVRMPDAIAVSYHQQQLTYRTLNRRANHLARELQAKGIKPGGRVALCLRRSPDLMVAVLAVLKAGAAYVPLDPSYPLARRRFMAQDAEIGALIANADLANELENTAPLITNEDAHFTKEDADPPKIADDPSLGAYVIYTSGSTGQPKGVAMPHGPLANLIRWQQQASKQGNGRTLQYSPIGFDVSFQEIFSTWADGGTLVMVDEEVRRDPAQLLQYLHSQHVVRLFLPFVALQQLAEAAARTPVAGKLREIITAGEQLQVTPALVAWFKRLPGCTLHNHYGPTETHVVTCHDLTGDPSTWPALPSIGRAITNARIYVLDRHLQPVPIGVTGELFIGGPVLANGYLGRDELTAARFVRDPYLTDGRAYRTGDLARWCGDGKLEFLGRADDQVKIRGFRVELGEIEQALAGFPGVRQQAVAAPGTGAHRRLVAYLVADPGRQLDHAEIRAHLRQQLPDYLVPTAFVDLPALPTTPSGKIDRHALPEIQPIQRVLDPGDDGVPPVPSISLHFHLLQVWEEVLDTRGIRLNDDFFVVGGNSLLAYRMMSSLEQQIGRRLPMSLLFENPTILQLSAAIMAGATPLERPLQMIQEGASGTPPFFFLHGDYLGGGYYCVSLARRLGSTIPFYALVPRAIDLDRPVPTISELAAGYLKEVRAVCPQGPYLLGGFCIGGIIAQEMAHQLRAAGQKVGLLALVDAQTRYPVETWARRMARGLALMTRAGPRQQVETFARLGQRYERLKELGPKDLLAMTLTKLGLRAKKPASQQHSYGLTSRMHTVSATTRGAYQQMNAYLWAACHHRPTPLDAGIHLVVSDEHSESSRDQTFGWISTADGVHQHRLPGSHLESITRNLPKLAEILQPLILAVRGEGQMSAREEQKSSASSN